MLPNNPAARAPCFSASWTRGPSPLACSATSRSLAEVVRSVSGSDYVYIRIQLGGKTTSYSSTNSSPIIDTVAVMEPGTRVRFSGSLYGECGDFEDTFHISLDRITQDMARLQRNLDANDSCPGSSSPHAPSAGCAPRRQTGASSSFGTASSRVSVSCFLASVTPSQALSSTQSSNWAECRRQSQRVCLAASSPYRAVQRATGISSVSTTCHPRHRVLAFPRRNHGLTQWRSIRGGRASGRAAC